MTQAMEFLLKYGYVVLFVAVLAEQIGLPVPSSPFLLAAGVLAGSHRLGFLEVLALAVITSLIGDCLWFYLGKREKGTILRLLCRISLEPEMHVAKSQSVYSRYGPQSLLVAKFIPGFSLMAPPMAGIFSLPLWKFMALDSGGALLWAGSFITTGWILRREAEGVIQSLTRFGTALGIAVALGLAFYMGAKYAHRIRIYRAQRIARITPDELKARMDAGESFSILDLRTVRERQEGRIPGSLQFTDDQLQWGGFYRTRIAGEFEFPVFTKNEMGRLLASMAKTEVVLYCSRLDEFRGARVALFLKRLGITRVRTLEGGFALWRDRGFPVEGPAAPAKMSRDLQSTASGLAH